MATKAIFVGINKCLDQAIPELVAAKRDATALWALFSDSIPGLSARLLVDDMATREAVTRAILDTLSAADEGDEVILTFAGHGSPDGHLVLSDTDPTNTAGTA